MAFLGYIKCLGYDIYVPVYSDIPANENITNAPIIKASSLHSVGYPDTIEGISQRGQGYVIYSNVGAEGAANSIANLFGKYHFEPVNGVTPFAGLVLGDNRNLDGYNRLYVHCEWYQYGSYWDIDGPVDLGWNPNEFPLCVALANNGELAFTAGNTLSTTGGHRISIPGDGGYLTVDNIANYLKLYQEREITDPAPIDPTSLLMGYRVGQMIRAMRGKKEPVAYLYNGVRLPKLPQVDDAEYQHFCIWIAFSGTIILAACKETPYFETFIIGGNSDEEFCIPPSKRYEIIGGAWEHITDISYLDHKIIEKVVWTDADIIDKDDESVVLAASEPIPVYE